MIANSLNSSLKPDCGIVLPATNITVINTSTTTDEASGHGDVSMSFSTAEEQDVDDNQNKVRN